MLELLASRCTKTYHSNTTILIEIATHTLPEELPSIIRTEAHAQPGSNKKLLTLCYVYRRNMN